MALAELLAGPLAADLLRVRVASERQPSDRPGGGAESIGDGTPTQEVHVGGSPARVLHELAESRDAAMLVLGSSHRAGRGRTLVGGVATKLLQGGPCPLAIAPRGFAEQGPGEPRVIGVAFDDSAESRLALELAARLGEATSAALRVISVYHGAAPGHDRNWPDAPTAYEEMQDVLRRAVRPLPDELRAEPRFLSGDPASVLVGESELGLGLIVMGSRGYGPLRSVLLGSVSEEVVRAAACPVIIVPRGVQSPGRTGR
jgi:nucleotide-binding universal stress UspA family protein